jgi:hypothetical protein
MRRVYRRVVIESPFGHPTKEGQDENLRYLRACMRDALDRGESPYASHGLYTQPGVLDDWDPGEREKGIQAGFEWRLVAQATIVYADRGVTPGMRAGIRKATELQAAGVFDHYVEYRMLGGEWSALGGPEEIRKHLDGLLGEHQSKHRHLALVTDGDGERRVHMMLTPGELSMEGVARRAKDGTIVTSVAEEAAIAGGLQVSQLQADGSLVPTVVDGIPVRGLTEHVAMIDDEQPFVRSDKPNGSRMESYQAAKESIPPWTVDERREAKERERAAQFAQDPQPTKLGVTSKKGRPCPHGTYYSLCPEPECVALVKDLLAPEKMSERTRAMFEGEGGGGALQAKAEEPGTDPVPYGAVHGPRGRMRDGVITEEEVKAALDAGAVERAEAEKRIPKR